MDESIQKAQQIYEQVKSGIDEDPVTGSAHTVIAPMWSKRFNKNELTARQCSPRGGNVGLRVHVDEASDDKGKLFTDNIIACFKCNKPQTNTHKLKNCECKAAKYCNSTCQTEHWPEHKAEHRRIVKAKGLSNFVI